MTDKKQFPERWKEYINDNSFIDRLNIYSNGGELISVVRVKQMVEHYFKSEREMGAWISVKDRLPDMCGCKVLVAANNRFGQTHVFTAFTGYMEHGKLEFHSCEPIYDDLNVWMITHWMPLPKPPKEGI